MAATGPVPSLASDLENVLFPQTRVDANCFSTAHQQSIAPGPEQSDNYGEEYMTAGFGLWTAVGSAAIGVAKWFSQEVAKRAWGSRMDGAAGWITTKFPAPLTGQERLIFEDLYIAENFNDGVERIMRGWPDLKPTDAIKYSFEFLYRYKPSNDLARSRLIDAERVALLMQTHNLTVENMYNIARLIHETHPWGNEHLWREVYDAFLEAGGMTNGDGRPVPLDKSLTESQEIYLNEMKAEGLRQELGAMRDIFGEMIRAIKAASTSGNGVVEKTFISQFKVNVGPDVLGQTMGRLGLIKVMKGVISKIDSGETLNESEMNFVARIRNANPLIKKIIDARTYHTDTAVRGTNLAISRIEVEHLTEAGWFHRILKEVSGYEGTVMAGVIVRDPATGTQERYEFWLNPPGLGRGNRFALYNEGEPYPVGPFSLSKGEVLNVMGDEVIVEDAIRIRDGRSRNYFITDSDMEHLRGIARAIRADSSAPKSPVGRAFFRFFNMVQSIGVAVYGDEFPIEPGSPSENITRIAKNLSRENWAAKLEQQLEWVRGEFPSVQSVLERAAAKETGNAKEFVELTLEEELTRVRTEHIERFRTDRRQRFKTLMNKLESTIRSGDAQARNGILHELSALIAKQVKSRTFDQVSLDPYRELSFWRGTSPEETIRYIKKRDVPGELREIVVMRGVDDSLLPSIERAERLVGEGSFEKAFLEFDRVSADKESLMETRMLAQARKAQVAVEKLQFQRAERAVEWIKWKEASGKEVTPLVREILDGLPPLNHGCKVVVTEEPVEVEKPPARSAPQSVTQEMEFDIKSIRPSLTRPIINAYKTTRDFGCDVGGPAVFGAMTFLGAKSVVELIFDPPRSHIEAVAQGYDTISLAVLIDRGAHMISEKIVSRGTEGFAAITNAPFMFSRFFGGLGSAAFVYRGIDGAMTDLGMSPKTSEVTSLVGTGVVLGGWKPFVEKVLTPTNAIKVTGAVEGVIAKGGLFYFLVDGAPTIAEAVYNEFDDPVSVMAREEWYLAMKEDMYQKSIFGDAENVPWYSVVGNTVSHVLDHFVPATFHKAVDPLLDDNADKWMDWCEIRLRAGQSCR